MSCACENMRLGRELERIYRLAKAWAKDEDVTVAIYRKDDGSYDFAPLTQVDEANKPIVEFVTPY